MDLADVDFDRADLSNADLSGAKLHDAAFDEAYLDDVDLSGADARGSSVWYADWGRFGSFDNFIDDYGRAWPGLHIDKGDTMRLWDFDHGTLDMPIDVYEGMSVDPSGTLRVVFEDDQWGSMITFQPDVPVALAGKLQLLVDQNAETSLSSLVGTTYQLFDWTGVSPVGQFDWILTQNELVWDTSRLYTTGEVTLSGAIPEPSALALVGLAATLIIRGRLRHRHHRCS